MEEIQLNNCPFCGSEVNIYKGEIWMRIIYYAKCSKCGARQDYVFTHNSHVVITKGVLQSVGEIITDKEAIQRVIEKWNNPVTG